jgi:hypothetical protein
MKPTNPFKPNLISIIFKNSVRTSMKTQHFTIIKINLLIFLQKIIAAYSESHIKLTNTL